MKLLQALALAGGMVGVGSVSLWAQAAPAPAPTPMAGMGHAPAVASTTLAVTVGGKTMTLGAAELAGMTQKTVSVHNSHKNVEESYTGVLLTEVLAKAGEGASGKALLRSYVKAEGTDKYWVLYSGIEIEGASHLGDVMVATALDGKALGAAGAFMLVSTEDKKPQRWVRNLAGLTLVKVE